MAAFGATETDGVFPYHVTADRVAWMRQVIDGAAAGAGRPRPALLVTLPVVLEPGVEAARAAARGYLASYLRTPNYQASWTAQGFDASDWEQPGSDRLVDAMVAWGPVPDLLGRVTRLHRAGADHVALIALGPDGTTEHLSTLEALAEIAAT